MIPLYDFECKDHGIKENVWAKMDEAVKCDCGKVMERLITATRIQGDIEPYVEYNMGHEPVYIKSRQHYYQELKKRGLHNVDDTRSPGEGRPFRRGEY